MRYVLETVWAGSLAVSVMLTSSLMPKCRWSHTWRLYEGRRSFTSAISRGSYVISQQQR